MNKIIVVATIIAFWLFLGYQISKEFFFAETSEGWSQYDDSYASEDCSIMGINAHGEFVTYASEYDLETGEALTEASSEDIVYMIEAAEEDPGILGILLDIDSYGGNAVAAEEIANALRNAQKPTVAVIRGAGASAAYWAATGADRIVASALSDVGGIGATASYIDASKFNENEGFTFNELSTGIYKDYGHPEKPLTEAERALIMRDLEIMKEKFVEAVATNRNMSLAEVEALADGSTVLGETALEKKLIDQIGSYSEAEAYLAYETGEPAEVCW